MKTIKIIRKISKNPRFQWERIYGKPSHRHYTKVSYKVEYFKVKGKEQNLPISPTILCQSILEFKTIKQIIKPYNRDI